MVTLAQALNLAEGIKPNAIIEGDEIIISEIKYFKRGWIFWFNSLLYMDTLDDKYYIFGASSVYVSRESGKIIEISSAFDAENYLESIICSEP